MLTSHWTVMNKKVLPIGLDIGHSSIKMVQLVLADDGVRVLAAQRSFLPPHSDDDDATRQSHITQAIRQLLTHGGFKGRNVVSALPNDKLWITSLRLPEGEAPHAEKALQREATQRFGLDPKADAISYVLAGSVRQGDELKNEYILFAAENEAIRNHIALLERTRLKPTGIDAVPCALFRNFERTMRRQEDRERTVIFIDVGHRYTTVVIGRAGEICFVKQLAFGMARFSEDVASQLDVSVEDAESLRLKLRNGEPLDASTHQLVADTATATGEQLAAEIALCLRYYTVTFRGRRVERVVVAGGGAHDTTMLDIIKRRLGIETEVAEPLRGFDLGGIVRDGSHRDSFADFALAVGLSLKGWGAPVQPHDQSNAQPEPVLEGELS